MDRLDWLVARATAQQAMANLQALNHNIPDDNSAVSGALTDALQRTEEVILEINGILADRAYNDVRS